MSNQKSKSSQKSKKQTSKNDKSEGLNFKKPDKKFYQNIKFWIALAVAGLVLAAIIVSFVISAEKQRQEHEKAVADYDSTWEEYGEAQRDFGYVFGLILGELGFSTDGSTKYNLDSETSDEISKQCAKEVDIYYEIYTNPYSIKNNTMANKNTADIKNAIDALTKYTEKINNAKESVEKCREIGQNKIKEIDAENAKKEAEEKAKADAQAAYKRNVLDYDKFTNQIKEGMSLSAVKNVYGRFDDECKISTQSGGYVIYSCSPSYYSSNYWAASFTFYNNVLKSKAQTGLK